MTAGQLAHSRRPVVPAVLRQASRLGGLGKACGRTQGTVRRRRRCGDLTQADRGIVDHAANPERVCIVVRSWRLPRRAPRSPRLSLRRGVAGVADLGVMLSFGAA